jgi:hypothetical protein
MAKKDKEVKEVDTFEVDEDIILSKKIRIINNSSSMFFNGIMNGYDANATDKIRVFIFTKNNNEYILAKYSTYNNFKNGNVYPRKSDFPDGYGVTKTYKGNKNKKLRNYIVVLLNSKITQTNHKNLVNEINKVPGFHADGMNTTYEYRDKIKFWYDEDTCYFIDIRVIEINGKGTITYVFNPNERISSMTNFDETNFYQYLAKFMANIVEKPYKP